MTVVDADQVNARLDAALDRIDEREPVVRAWVNRHDEAELRQQVAAGLPAGPLQGWPFGVKDVIDTADLPTERGSPIHAGRTTTNDAACVALARRAGALVVGKTATTEFALFTPTVTTNPHDPERTPGGSSSGSAAAVADGMVRAAFGTQTVGSVIRPAAFCGVVGFKPTHQLVPLTGVATLAHSFDTVGWLTTDVADAGAVLAAVSGPGDLEAARADGSGPERPRIGRYRSHQWTAAEPETGPQLDRTADRLADAGLDLVDVEPLDHLAGVFEAADVVLHYEVSRVFAWERQHHNELISRPCRRMMDRADQVTAAQYRAAQITLDSARHRHRRWLADNGIDALLTPSAPGEAPPLATTGDSVFNRTWTALGVPALHLPTGRGPTGLPLGVQLTGTAWGDVELLALGARVESVLATG
ncbi:MAG: amidase [Actinomycetota bacterium]